MLLFHKLDETDQHNAIHYCMHIVVEDMLEDGVELEPFSDEDKKMKVALEKVIAEAKIMPQDGQFDYVVHNQEVGQMIFDIALDMARSAFYAGEDEMVIHYEALRQDPAPDENQTEISSSVSSSKTLEKSEILIDVMEEINMLNSRKILN